MLVCHLVYSPLWVTYSWHTLGCTFNIPREIDRLTEDAKLNWTRSSLLRPQTPLRFCLMVGFPVVVGVTAVPFNCMCFIELYVLDPKRDRQVGKWAKWIVRSHIIKNISLHIHYTPHHWPRSFFTHRWERNHNNMRMYRCIYKTLHNIHDQVVVHTPFYRWASKLVDLRCRSARPHIHLIVSQWVTQFLLAIITPISV